VYANNGEGTLGRELDRTDQLTEVSVYFRMFIDNRERERESRPSVNHGEHSAVSYTVACVRRSLATGKATVINYKSRE